MNDQNIAVVVWRGPQSALAARMGIAPARLNTLLKRCAFKRAGHLEIEVASPTAMLALRRVLAMADEGQ